MSIKLVEIPLFKSLGIVHWMGFFPKIGDIINYKSKAYAIDDIEWYSNSSSVYDTVVYLSPQN